jgi:hypothetical protein
MNASKYLVSTAAALAVVGAIGIAVAQTSTMAPASAPTAADSAGLPTDRATTTAPNAPTTNAPMNSSSTQTPMDSTTPTPMGSPNTDSNMPRDTSTMSADRDQRADRN